MDKKGIKDLLKKFTDFINSEIKSAIVELGKIKTESNRKHLQHLVYINLINRFDSFLDSLLLGFSVSESQFKERVLNEAKEAPVFLKDLYEILLSNNPVSSVKERVQGIVRFNFLNRRHSSKLRTLLKDCFEWPDSDLDRPRVFTNNGSIFQDTKRLSPYKIPDTVIGYSDWLYSRRNAMVHGDKPKIGGKDVDFMQKKYNVELSRSISLKISSIKSAEKFYLDLVGLLVRQIDSVDRDTLIETLE